MSFLICLRKLALFHGKRYRASWTPDKERGSNPLRVLLIVSVVAATPAIAQSQELPAQQSPIEIARGNSFPNAPDAAAAVSADSTARKASGSIAGTVLDGNGAEIQGARVELTGQSGSLNQVSESGSDGQFMFRGVPAGRFKLMVTGPGWGTFVSSEIQLHDGEFRIVPGVVLPMATAVTQVTVVGDKTELSVEQVHIALQQRVLGVLPNFYSSYDWHAPPMLAKQKYQLAFRSLIDPVTVAGVAAVAGAEQINNTFSGFGPGAQGYAKRFGAAYANEASTRMLGSAVFPALFHEDPRYFYKGTGSVGSRTWYAMSGAVMTRDDNGAWRPNYARILGTFAAGGLSNLYYPAADRGAALTFENGAIALAAHAGTNLVREFVLKRFTTQARGTNP